LAQWVQNKQYRKYIGHLEKLGNWFAIVPFFKVWSFAQAGQQQLNPHFYKRNVIYHNVQEGEVVMKTNVIY